MYQKSIKINALLNTIKTISNICFPLITFPYISRVLQPENLGKINFGVAYVSYFSMIASLGITTYAIRECASVKNDKDELGKRASEIFSINICTTIVAYILLIISLLTLKKVDNYRELIMIQSMSIMFVTLGTEWLNSAMEDFAYITWRTIFFQAVSLILTFCLVKSSGDYLKYAIISVISSSGANIVNIFYRRKYCRVIFTKNMNWKKHFKPIILLFVMIFAQTIFSSADQTMLGIMKNNYEVGIYSTALKIENVISQVISSLVWVVMPRLSQYFEKGDYTRINELLKKVLSLLMCIGLPSIVGVCVLSKEVVMIVGGKNYFGASSLLRILMLSFGFSLIGGSFLGNMVLLPSKKENTYMWICCVTAIFNVALNYILIPYGGGKAAAFTTMLSSALIMTLLLLKKDKRISLNYIGRISFSPIIGSLVIGAYCKIVSHFIHMLLLKTIICIIGSVIIYICVLIGMKNDLCIEVLEELRSRRKHD